MRITLFFINWEDSFYFPFIEHHYGQFCDRIVMYDNYSKDNSLDLAKKLGFEVKRFGYSDHLNDQNYLDVKNHCWKEERGKSDYVIVCDADEFIMPMNKITGNFPRMMGYNMISNHLPTTESIFDIRTGAIDNSYAKQAIFDPNAVQEIAFVHGCHKNNAVVINEDNSGVCSLYHFRQIGGVDRMLNRHALYRKRLSKFNLKNNMGHHYGRPDWTTDQIESFNNTKRQEWDILLRNARNLWPSTTPK